VVLYVRARNTALNMQFKDPRTREGSRVLSHTPERGVPCRSVTMRAMTLLVLALALVALFPFHEPILQYWRARRPAIVACISEGRFADAFDVALGGGPPDESGPRSKDTETTGEEPSELLVTPVGESSSPPVEPADPDST